MVIRDFIVIRALLHHKNVCQTGKMPQIAALPRLPAKWRFIGDYATWKLLGWSGKRVNLLN
jgi:hypothetical protein